MNDPTKRRADDGDASEKTEAPGDYERVDAEDVVEDAIDLFAAGSDDDEQVAEPIDGEPGPIPNA